MNDTTLQGICKWWRDVKLKDKHRDIWGGSTVRKDVRWGEEYVQVNTDR